MAHFLAHFPHFWAKQFSPKVWLSRITSCEFQTPCQNLEKKTNDLIPRNFLDGNLGRRKNYCKSKLTQKWFVNVYQMFHWFCKSYACPLPESAKTCSELKGKFNVNLSRVSIG